jgi:glycine dehydrogenase subunit 1
MSGYIPNTEAQRKEMLSEIGLSGIGDLFAGVPDNIKLNRRLDLPEAMPEMEMAAHMRGLAGRNINADEYTCFLGAGAYDHYIPGVVKHMISRQEFYTAYTPYQPEISQGTLQAIFEYQTMICDITGMDVANASMYDGASALAEAASMACRAANRKEVLVAENVHPESREVLRTYSRFNGNRVAEFGFREGRADLEALESKLSQDTAAVIIQTPNFFGIIEDLKEAAELVHKNKSLLVVSCDPVALAILKPPGELGADIVTGEGQSLGNPLSFGGPYLGFFAAKKEFLRRMPGRIAGETADKDGRRGFVLTIQTREQHIRREKATSNICSNQALNALAAAVYLTAMGRQGLKDVALLCTRKAHYACEKLIKTGLFSMAFNAPFFKEFALHYEGDVAQLNNRLLSNKIIGGYELGRKYPGMENKWLLAVTEKRTREEIDRLAEKVVGL